MICERSRKVHIREFGRELPVSLHVSGIWVRLAITPCQLGGHRYWFLCPTCGRRCAILYPRQCRKCMNGRYAKELMTPHDRKIDKAIDLRARLGQTSGGLLATFPTKPKWMRWHTYLRLRTESLALEKEIWKVEHTRFPVAG